MPTAEERDWMVEQMRREAAKIAEKMNAQLPEGVTVQWDDAPIDHFGTPPPPAVFPVWPMAFPPDVLTKTSESEQR